MVTASPAPPIRRCSRCQAFKPHTPDYFPRERKAKSGLRAQCKTCDRKRQNVPTPTPHDTTTVSHIAWTLGVSKARVVQLTKSGLAKLRTWAMTEVSYPERLVTSRNLRHARLLKQSLRA